MVESFHRGNQRSPDQGGLEYDPHSLGIVVEALNYYLREPITEEPVLQEIPLIINKLLAPVFTAECVEEAKMTGSVVRFLGGETDKRFWQFPKFFKAQAEQETNPETKEILGKLAYGPADVDFQIRLTPEHEVIIDPDTGDQRGGLGRVILEKIGYFEQGGTLERKEVAYRDDGSPIVRFFSEELPLSKTSDVTLSLNFGQHHGNPDKEVVEIKFTRWDREGRGETIFRNHIAFLPAGTEGARRDRRLGETNDKQDLCTLRVVSDGQNLLFANLKEELVEVGKVMKREDKLPPLEILETKSVEALAELAIRTVRIDGLHSFGDLFSQLTGGEQFFPLIYSRSLFDLRSALQTVALKGDVVPKETQVLILRELFLSLTADPYLTMMFLRDTGLTALIPGLSHLTLEDWTNLLFHPELDLCLDKNEIRTMRPETPDYLAIQSATYRQGGIKKIEENKGGERFVKALEELGLIRPRMEKESCWSRLVRLFNREERQTLPNIGEQIMIGVIERLVVKEERQGFMVIERKNQGEVTGVEVARMEHFRIIDDRPRDEYEIEAELRQSVDRYLRETEIETWFHGFKLDRRMMEDIIKVMVLFPAGLTAKEIARLTVSEGGERFARQFLLIKLTGMIARVRRKRKGVDERERETDFYCLRRDFNEVESLVSLKDNEKLDSAFYRVRSEKHLKKYGDLLRFSHPPKLLKRYLNAFSRGGIYSIQTLKSLTKDDFGSELIHRITNVGYRNDCLARAEEILKAYDQMTSDER